MRKQTAKSSESGLEQRISELEEEIRTYEEAATAAREADQHGPSVAALKAATMLREQRAHHRAELRGMGITDALERVRYMGRRAGAAGSFVAQKDLYREERAIEAERAAAAQAAAEAAARDADQLWSTLEAVFADLTQQDRDRAIGLLQREH